MSTLVHAKQVRGKKVWYVWGAEGNNKWIKEYPQCKDRFEFYETLREELGLPVSADRHQVFWSLLTKTWTGDKWQDDFAIRLKSLRETRKLTQTQLAEKAGLSVQAISALENGTRAPTWDTVRRLAVAIEVDETAFKDTVAHDDVWRSAREVI
jgi:DNA-binding XRE family transcriptional regulator